LRSWHLEKFELVRSVYAIWRRGETAIDVMADDVVCDLSRRQLEPEIYAARRVRRFARQLFQARSELRQEPSEYVAAGERVLVLLAMEGRGRPSGVQVDERSRTSGPCATGRSRRSSTSATSPRRNARCAV